MNAAELVVYVDVDDTLVRSVGHKRIPIPAAIEHVRAMHRADATLYCWSAGGAAYARATAQELGIDGLFTACLPKPHVMVDDQPPSAWPRCVVAHPLALHANSLADHLRAVGGA